VEGRKALSFERKKEKTVYPKVPKKGKSNFVHRPPICPPSDIGEVENVTLVPRNYSSLHVMSAKIRARMYGAAFRRMTMEENKEISIPFFRKRGEKAPFIHFQHLISSGLSCVQSIQQSTESLKFIEKRREGGSERRGGKEKKSPLWSPGAVFFRASTSQRCIEAESNPFIECYFCAKKKSFPSNVFTSSALVISAHFA
jgi:hypothetical protein